MALSSLGKFIVIIDLTLIRDRLSSLKSEYVSAQPFPHVALNGLFDLDMLRSIELEFPATDQMGGSSRVIR